LTAVALALSASIAWGCADFLGGLYSRRYSVAPVTLLTQLAGLAGAAVALAIAGGPSGIGIGLGALAGFFSGVGATTYYAALAAGTMSVVAPISACGAVVSLGLALAFGERPSPLRLAGALLALCGAVLASFQEHRAGGTSRLSILLALATALAFGVLLYVLGRAADAGGTFSALVGVRFAASVVVGIWVASLANRPPFPGGRVLAVVLFVGLLGTVANALYGFAAERGLLAIVSLLASLYPVTTVVLANRVLHERLAPVQAVGVVVALAGVSLVAVG
jgi:drug/metabolite transporter (DMT)-like permease